MTEAFEGAYDESIGPTARVGVDGKVITSKNSSIRGDDEIPIPVLNFLLLKHVIDDGDGLVLVGTFVQNCFRDQTPEIQNETIEFQYRFNDESANDDNLVHRRTEEKDSYLGRHFRHTYQVKLPLEMNTEIDLFPFRVLSARCLIELSTFTNEDNTIKCRPVLHLHQDKRNAICLQEDQLLPALADGVQLSEKEMLKEAMNKMDKTENYDFVSPFPEVKFLFDRKKKYSPKYIIKFVMVENGYKRFVEVVFPMLLVAVMNHVNIISYVPDDGGIGDFIANAAAFSLAVVVYLPMLVSTSRTNRLFSLNNAYVIFILLAMVLSSIPQDFSRQTRNCSYVGDALFWLSFAFPLFSAWNYYIFFTQQKNPPLSYFMKMPGSKEEYKPYKPPKKLIASSDSDKLLSIADVVNMEESDLDRMKLKTAKTRKFDVVEYA